MPPLDTPIALRCVESGIQLFYSHQPAELVTQFVLKLLLCPQGGSLAPLALWRRW